MSLLHTLFLSSMLLPPVAGASPALAPTSLRQDAGVTELVTRGLELMRKGQLEEAVTTLQEADTKDGGELRTRMWLIRAMIERNYLNDALNMTDELSEAGNTGPDLDYLYGMSFVYKARKYISQGVNLGTVGMHYGDAVGYLASATSANPEKYADAFLPLAEAAWNSQDLVVARGAAEVALEGTPESIKAALMLGEVAFSQFVVANGSEETQAEADAHWRVALDAFVRASKVAGASAGDLARAHKKAADAFVWKGKLPEAGTHYAEAMGLDATAVDYGQVLNSLGADPFLACIEQGAAAFTKRHGERTQADATLQWWLGWSRFTHQDYKPANEAFALAYKKWPAYTNCKWYMGLCAYHGQDYDTARDLIVENFALDPPGLAASINGNAALNTRIVEYLIGKCAGSGKNIEAAQLSEALALAAPETSRFWNNAGLFYRDAGDIMSRTEGEVDTIVIGKLYEKSLRCYVTALKLEPENPNYLNDTAVLLHYNLDRDLERALELYKLSYEYAVRDLERTDLEPETRAAVQIAKRDSKNNRRLLEKQLAERLEAEREAEAERKAKEEAEAEAERLRREKEAAGGAQN